MCLDGTRLRVDDRGMDTTEPIYRMTCFRCERPALTFDEQERALCSRHATIFLTATRVTAKDDEWWDSLPVEASPRS